MRILETVITLILVSPFGLPFNYKVNRSLINQSIIFGPLTKKNANLVSCWFSCVLLLLEILPTIIFFGDIPVGQRNSLALLDTHPSAWFLSFLRWHVSFRTRVCKTLFFVRGPFGTTVYEKKVEFGLTTRQFARNFVFYNAIHPKSVNVSYDQNNLCFWPRAIWKTFFFSFPLRANAQSRGSQLKLQQSNLFGRVNWLCDNAVSDNFSFDISVILILNCAIFQTCRIYVLALWSTAFVKNTFHSFPNCDCFGKRQNTFKSLKVVQGQSHSFLSLGRQVVTRP